MAREEGAYPPDTSAGLFAIRFGRRTRVPLEIVRWESFRRVPVWPDFPAVFAIRFHHTEKNLPEKVWCYFELDSAAGLYRRTCPADRHPSLCMYCIYDG